MSAPGFRASNPSRGKGPSSISVPPPPPSSNNNVAVATTGKNKTKKKKNAVTPDPRRSDDGGLSKRMSVEKSVVDELLLVCGVIGTTTGGGENGTELVPVTDCLNWLQDLQRALRRDDDLYRPISLLLADWRVVAQKLLPLALTCRYDNALVLTICKILVILTKPLSDNAVRAGKMVIDTKKNPPEVVQQQIKLRDNALKQADAILEYKRVVCHHSSHFHRKPQPASSAKNNSPSKQQQEGGILSVFVALLAEPLSRTGTARTDADHLAIELVLHLFCNLLRAEPLLVSSSEQAAKALQLHNELVALLEQELVLEILLVLASDLEARENAPYNLLLLELVHHLFRDQDPAAVARAGRGGAGAAAAASSSGPSFKSALAARAESRPLVSARHGHFAGTLAIQSAAGGPQKYVSAARLGDPRGATSGPPPAVPKRKHKRTDPFLGGGSRGPSSELPAARGPAQTRAWGVLDTFCRRFFEDCYGAVLKSWKNEFRRDSVRLQQDDLAVFLRIVWFLKQWRRISGATDLGPLVFTMDVFTFNLVLNATDSYTQRKHWGPLAHAIALLGEMVHWLVVMDNSSEPTERLMAMGLMDRLFYANEPLDRLPRLLARWEPGTSTRRCLADLVELAHVTLKLLDANSKRCREGDPVDKKEAKHDTLAKMRAAAADFDVNTYFARKLVSNHTIYMYTQLLAHYATNAAHTNHRILAFFLRLSKFAVALPDDSEVGSELHPLPTKKVTLEPMLYNVQLLALLDKVLNDRSIRSDPKFEALLTFATSLVTKFAKAAQANPLLFAEALFRHPVPHRFCELSTHLYVSDELRMLAERDLLLEQHRHWEAAEGAAGSGEDEGEEDSDEELEFEDFGLAAAPKPAAAGDASDAGRGKTGRGVAKLRGGLLDDSSSDDESHSSALERARKKPRLAEKSADAEEADHDSDDEKEEARQEE